MRKALVFIAKWIAIFILASILVFVIVRMMPTTPVEKWLDAYHLPRTEENIAYLTAKMGLDEPLIVQYFTWITGFFTGDWGVSLISGENIRDKFLTKMPYSFSIGFAGIILGGIAAFFLGYRAALHRNGLADRFSSVLTVFAQCVPQFIIAIPLCLGNGAISKKKNRAHVEEVESICSGTCCHLWYHLYFFPDLFHAVADYLV